MNADEGQWFLFVFPYASLFSQILVACAVIYTRTRLVAEMRTLALYTILSTAIGIFQLVLALNRIDNQWTFQLFCPIQFILLMTVFHSWNRRSFVDKYFLFSSVVYALGWILGIIVSGSLENTNTYADPISGVILILAATYTLLRIERIEGTSLLDMPSFWVSSAVIIYFGGTIVLSSLNAPLLRLFKTSPEPTRLAWSTQSIANVIGNILYIRAFLCLRLKT